MKWVVVYLIYGVAAILAGLLIDWEVVKAWQLWVVFSVALVLGITSKPKKRRP